MNAAKIEILLGMLNCRKIKTTGNRVRSSCPLFWRHGGKDEHPSFVVFATDDDESKCKCLGAGCGFGGTLIQLAWAIQAKIGHVPNVFGYISQHDSANFAQRLENINLGVYSGRKDLPGAVEGGIDPGDLISIADRSPWLEGCLHYVYEMQKFLDDNRAISYLRSEKRRVSDASIERWQLGWHPGARRVSIPQFDHTRRLVNIGGRYVSSENDDPFWTPPPWMHANGFKKELFLFGEDKFVSYDGQGTGVLVEGMFDAIFLDSRGIPNVMAMLGAHLSKTQYAKIVRWFNKLVIVPDGDQPGYEAADRIMSTVGQKIQVVVFPTANGKDPDNLDDSEVDDLKNYCI